MEPGSRQLLGLGDCWRFSGIPAPFRTHATLTGESWARLGDPVACMRTGNRLAFDGREISLPDGQRRVRPAPACRETPAGSADAASLHVMVRTDVSRAAGTQDRRQVDG